MIPVFFCTQVACVSFIDNARYACSVAESRQKFAKMRTHLYEFVLKHISLMVCFTQPLLHIAGKIAHKGSNTVIICCVAYICFETLQMRLL